MVAHAMSGFVSTISGFLSTIGAKDLAIGGFLSSIGGSLSSISGFTKIRGHPASVDVLNNSGFLYGGSFAMSGFLSTISAKDVAIGESLSTIGGSLSTISDFTKNGDIQLWWMSLTN